MRIFIELLILIILINFLTSCATTQIPDYRIKIAIYKHNSGKYEEALKYLEKEISKNPDNDRAYYNYGNYLMELGRFAEAKTSYEQAIELCYSERLSYTFTNYHASIDNLSYLNILLGNFSEAIEQAKAASIPGYDLDLPLLNLAFAQILDNNLNEGINNLKKYEEKNPDSVNSDILLMKRYLSKEISLEGLLAFLKSYTIKANPNIALEYLQIPLLELPNDEEIIKLKQAYQNPDYFQAKIKDDQLKSDILSSEDHLQKGEIYQARDLIIKLSEKYPELGSVKQLKAQLMISQGKIDKGLKIFQDLVDCEPQNQSYTYNLGWAYMINKNYPEAKIYFKKVLKLNPQYPEANLNLGGIFWMQDHDYQSAIQYFRNEINMNPRSHKALYSLGRIYFEIDKYTSSLEILHDYIEIYPADFEVRLYIAESYKQNGDFDDFNEYMNESLIYFTNEAAPKFILNIFEISEERPYDFDVRLKIARFLTM